MILSIQDKLEFVGKKFGKLTVLNLSDGNQQKTSYDCLCECGNKTVATYAHLKSGKRTSCGCHRPGRLSHGMRRTKVYSIWCDMLKRCKNPNSISYRYYGAKGISVCERWRSFETFYADMGDAPDGMSIDRIDPTGNYEPANCRWADAKTQTHNRPCQKMYDYNGRPMTLPEIAEATGIKYRTLRSRLFRTGMSLDEALGHEFGAITKDGMDRLKSAVIASNVRRGHQSGVTAAKGIV